MSSESLIADLIGLLDEDRRYQFEERAGIMEFDGGQDRDQAELLALVDLLRSHPGALLGVSLLRVTKDGARQYVLAIDSYGARDRLQATDVWTVEACDLAEALRGDLGGVALLTPIPTINHEGD